MLRSTSVAKYPADSTLRPFATKPHEGSGLARILDGAAPRTPSRLVRSATLAFLISVCSLRSIGTEETIALRFHGQVIAERSDVLSLPSPAGDLVIRWQCADGADLPAGAPIMRFDNLDKREHLRRLRDDRRIAVLRAAEEERELAIALEDLQDERTRLRQRLAVTRASLARATRVDPERVALLGAELRTAELDAAAAKRELARRRELHAAGQVAANEMAAAELAAAHRRGDVELAELRWQLARGRVDTLTVARLRLEEHELVLQLGKDETTTRAGGKRGLAKRIEAVEKEIAEKRKRAAFSAQRAERKLQEALRDTWDHTPLAWLEVSPPDGEPVRRISFQPADQPAPEGWDLDHGLPFTAERGHGWDHDHRERLVGGRTGDPERRGLILARGPARWSCRLPGPSYDLRLGIGDTSEWHGARLAVDGADGERVLLAADRLKDTRVLEARVRTRDGRLRLMLGTPDAKSLLAPSDGIARPQHWVHVGTRTSRTNWPIAYFCKPDTFKLQARVHQDDVPLLRTVGAEAPVTEAAARTRALRIARARAAVATDSVRVHLPNGGSLPGTIRAIGSSPVVLARGRSGWWDEEETDPKNRIAREVTIGFAPADARRLHLGEDLACTAHIAPAAGTRVLPAHLIFEDAGRLLVRCAETGSVPVEGFRVADRFFVNAGLPAGARPVLPPPGSDDAASDRRFRGEVVPGLRTQVGIPTFWGRIETLVADGSEVEEGQRIITLYNPWLRENRKRLAEQKERARQEYLVAVETRRVKAVQTELKHHTKLLAERRARLDLLAAERIDPLASASAANALRLARLEETAAREELARLRRVPGTPTAVLQRAELDLERSELARRSVRLDHVQTLHGLDWPAVWAARSAWHAAEAALDLREEELAIVRKEEKVARMLAELRLDQAMEGNWAERTFARIREVQAPASGRLFYRSGYNDQTRSMTKIGKDFVVWGGLTIAEILDMRELGLEAELPERLYTSVAVGDTVEIGFRRYPGLRIEGRIERVGKDFSVPEDLRGTDPGRRAASVSRVFTIEVRFRPPTELARHLVPGTAGFVSIP